MRALEPNESGRLTLRGFQLYYELFGDSQAPPLLCVPTWQIVPSRHWKMQIPYFARYFRLITWDPPGIGGAERTTDPQAFECDRVVDYAVGLLDHLGIDRADLMGLSMGGTFGLWLAARYPERVKRVILISSVPPEWAYGEDPQFWITRDSYQGWQKRNAHYWRQDYAGWLDFFFDRVCSEPHSTKSKEDLVRWANETTPDILISSVINNDLFPKMALDEALDRVQCPVLLMHGTDDQIASVDHSRMMARKRPDWEYLEMEESSHAPHWRNPVKTNLAMSDFLGVPQPKWRVWRRSMSRHKPKALFVSSPIGLGHAQRDVAIARELRRLVPELEIEWLAQDPVTRVLEAAGETIHPMSELLVSESAHWEQSAGEHELHCFFAWRNMDEILLANFMVFLEAVRETPYDLWLGDESWEVDYYLHENPEVKTAPFVFLTDFLGWLPIDRSPGSRDVYLTTDYNAEMIEQVARYPRVRDRAIYIGDYDDLIPESFGAGLPMIPDWTRENYRAVGYITPFDPADYTDTRALRTRLGYDPDRPLIFYAVGGTSVGRYLLRKAIDAWPLIHRERPDIQGIVIAGPRLAPDSLPRHPGLEIRPYVHNLYEHLAAADLAVVQGGLGTTMELTATRRPFIYFPLKNHCEQVYHVTHRLERYRAGQRLDYDEVNSEALAEAVLSALTTDTGGYLPYDPHGAARAAALIAELL